MWIVLEDIDKGMFPTKVRSADPRKNGTNIEDLCHEIFRCRDNNVRYTEQCLQCQTKYSEMTTNESIWDCNPHVWKDAPIKPKKGYKNGTMQQWLDT